MSSNSSIPAFYKNEIREDDIKKLKEIFGKMEKDRKAAGFLEPVDYEGLQLYDYPTIIKHPMDLGTCKTKLLNGDYWKLSDYDFDFLWKKSINEVKFGKVDFRESVKLFSVYKYLIKLNNPLKLIFS